MARFATSPLNAAVAAALVPGTTYYLSLHSADVGTTGANNASISVPNAGTTAATHFGVWSASTAGTYLGGGALTASTTAASITFASGAVTITAA